MEISRGQIFNLWDTNGRRYDVLNALNIYLQILCEIRDEYPDAYWGRYPESVAQFVFYEKALEYSPEVFQKHSHYDAFLDRLGRNYETFLCRNKSWNEMGLDAKDFDSLDKNIEARARHYTTNLVKMGFVDSKRQITPIGSAFLKRKVQRDILEDMLPIDDINLILLRQLLKLKIFTTPDSNGNRRYYSPFLMALWLLLNSEFIEKNTFFTIVQGLSPYTSQELLKTAFENSADTQLLEKVASTIDIRLPNEFQQEDVLPYDVFEKHIKNTKSKTMIPVYYDFYCSLASFRKQQTEESLKSLVHVILENRSALQKAFGRGKPLFDLGRNRDLTLDEFLERNRESIFWSAENLNSALYIEYKISSRIDDIREYSDTTERLLGATGIFKFGVLPELSYKELLLCFFDSEELRDHIFGVMSQEEFEYYEVDYMSELPLSVALRYESDYVEQIANQVVHQFGLRSFAEIHTTMRSKASQGLISHIADKYPKERIMELLALFSDRKNDDTIKKAVNDTADVPTIYEYIVGIAWYYISGRNFDLYSSFNLTLNADFEPVMHAGGGEGDIVIHYDKLVVMLEVTLMNKQAQKRGEWEPVLRHSLNLKAAVEPKESMTFFVADELDYNTVNIWRAVAAASLESTNTHEPVDGVVIMPFVNSELVMFLKSDIPATAIISAMRESFAKVPRIRDDGWKENIMLTICE